MAFFIILFCFLPFKHFFNHFIKQEILYNDSENKNLERKCVALALTRVKISQHWLVMTSELEAVLSEITLECTLKGRYLPMEEPLSISRNVNNSTLYTLRLDMWKYMYIISTLRVLVILRHWKRPRRSTTGRITSAGEIEIKWSGPFSYETAWHNEQNTHSTMCVHCRLRVGSIPTHQYKTFKQLFWTTTWRKNSRKAQWQAQSRYLCHCAFLVSFRYAGSEKIWPNHLISISLALVILPAVLRR